MKGHKEVIACVQELIKAELTAINQYILHAEMCENWGYKRLAAATKREAIGEMKHAEAAIERMLYLDGEPDMQHVGPLRIGKTVKEQLQNDLQLEIEAVKRLNIAVATAVKCNDNGSRELFERVLKDEEEHVDRLEAQLHMIKEMGYEQYLAQQVGQEAGA
jgi:bacterioferritin